MALLASVLLPATLAIPSHAHAQTTTKLHEFKEPFSFSYGAWQNKVKVENGVALIEGVSNAGGAGVMLPKDLSAASELTPVIRLKVGELNQAGAVRVLLMDKSQHTATFVFPLQGLTTSSADWLEVVAKGGASLSNPNESKDGALDLASIVQVQVQGDWAGNKPISVQILEILLKPADAAITALREDAAREKAAAKEQVRLQGEDLKKKYGTRSEKSPRIEHVSLVAPDVLAIDIQAGKVIMGSLEKYTALPEDKIIEKKETSVTKTQEIREVLLQREGKIVGWLLPTWGPQRGWLKTVERLEGDPLLEAVADDVTNYTITSREDPAYRSAVKPSAVYRKSKPNDASQGIDMQFAIRHTIYLRLPQALSPGKSYTISLGELNTQTPEATLAFTPSSLRSEAIHVSQIGYRPDDPAKRAFVSCWLGTGGNLPQPESRKFSLVNDVTNKVVYSGISESRWPAEKLETMARTANFNGTDVLRLDFSDFQVPGRYRVVVEGIGSSYPFEIGRDTWTRAFVTQMRGLYNQRSGVELGPPYTEFKKPRDMNPKDGFPVFRTSHRSIEKGGQEDFAAISAGATTEAVPQAWGGYHDAGDWNPRRVTHMRVTMASLEIFELFPKFFEPIKHNIPQEKGLPDVLAEAVFEVDTFRRLQNADGGVPLGIECGRGDPMPAEVSWLQSAPNYVFAADYQNSFYYAATAARLAYVMKPYDATRAGVYKDSAIRAMKWAEKDYAAAEADGRIKTDRDVWLTTDFRNLAAVELYRLTKDKAWHDIFLKNTVLVNEPAELFAYGKAVQSDAAFVYARLPAELGDPVLKARAVAGLRVMADRELAYASKNAFGLTASDQGKPQFIGFYTAPDSIDVGRVHFLTGDPRYLVGLVQSTQFQSGANPGNLVFTSGLGANPVKHPFKLDARFTGQKVPEGLTPYGIIDFGKWNQNWITWPITWHLSKTTTPDPYAWPTHEAYWDVGMWPALNEFVVDAWAPNVWVWGYLAARETMKDK